MWNETCEKTLVQCVTEFDKHNIRYFIFRNYIGLPKENTSKDIDIVVDPKKIKTAIEVVKQAYKENGLMYYDQSSYDRLICTHAVAGDFSFGIHIDLLAGYIVKGYEIYPFEHLYNHTKKYNGLTVPGEFYNGLMLFISKLFGYKQFKLKDKYFLETYEVYQKYTNQFEKEIIRLFGEKNGKVILSGFQLKDKSKLAACHEIIETGLKKYSFKQAPIKTAVKKIRFVALRFSRIVVHYRKNKRVLALNQNISGFEQELKTLKKTLNNVYVDKKCAEIYRDKNSLSEKIKLTKELMHNVHYDKISILVVKDIRQVPKSVPEALYIDQKEKLLEVLTEFCNKYTEKIN